jgi:hypothetical protein
MKKAGYLLAVTLLAVVGYSCGQYAGDSPVGTTGGGESGYGSPPGWAFNQEDGATDVVASTLLGTWAKSSGSGETWTFNRDLSYVTKSSSDSRSTSGTWSLQGTALTIDGVARDVSCNGSELSIRFGNTVRTYHKISS